MSIIGVVAAMTIPSLMGSTNGLEYATGVKKAMSVLSQAATLNYTTEGWDFSGGGPCGNGSDCEFSDIIFNNMKVASYNDGDDECMETSLNRNFDYNIRFSDGMILAFSGDHPYGNTTAYVDVNGSKGPNELNTPDSVGSNCNLTDIFKLTLNEQDAVIADDAVAKCVNKK